MAHCHGLRCAKDLTYLVSRVRIASTCEAVLERMRSKHNEMLNDNKYITITRGVGRKHSLRRRTPYAATSIRAMRAAVSNSMILSSTLYVRQMVW